MSMCIAPFVFVKVVCILCSLSPPIDDKVATGGPVCPGLALGGPVPPGAVVTMFVDMGTTLVFCPLCPLYLPLTSP